MISALFLPNVRQTEKNAAFVHDTAPSPHRNDMSRHGVLTSGCDLFRFPLNPLAGKGPFYAGFDPLRALRVLLFHRKHDVVICTFESGLLVVLALAKLFRFKPKIVMWEVSARGWPKRDKVLDFVVPRVDHVLVLTRHQKMRVEATYKLRNPAQIVGFAVDDEFYRPLPVSREDFILSVGDDIGRDYTTLIAACEPTPYRLVLRTNRPPSIPEGMRHRVTILARQSYVDLRHLYARAAVVVVPMLEVDHPSGVTAVFEGMAMGCAVVATLNGTTRDCIADQETGCLVPAGDVPAMTSAITNLMQRPDKRESMGLKARQAIDGPLSHDQYIQRFAQALHHAAKQSGTC